MLTETGSSFEFDTVSVASTGIRSLRMIGGSVDAPNSVFYDNITLTAVPEPSTFFGMVLVGVLGIRKRSRVRAFRKT